MPFNQKYWGKFSRKEWLINEDRNSKIFQCTANVRRKTIIKIRDKRGVWVTDQINITDKFIANYSQRFKSPNNYSKSLPQLGLSPRINEEDNTQLIRLPDIDEVKQALFSIDSAKTPGPDGFSTGFFKHYWNFIKNIYPIAFESFKNGKILKKNQPYLHHVNSQSKCSNSNASI